MQQPDLFMERLAKVRLRFASTLEARISDARAALPQLSRGDPASLEKLADTYQKIHGICGVGPTVGFPATGRFARDAENVLLPPFRDNRGLTALEARTLGNALEALRVAARAELQAVRKPTEKV
jgi:hypothetical protein